MVSLAARLFFRPLAPMVQRAQKSTSLLAAGRQGRKMNGSHAALLGLSAVVFTAAAFEAPTIGERRRAQPVGGWMAVPFLATMQQCSASLIHPRVTMCASTSADPKVDVEISAADDASFYYERMQPPNRSLAENHAIFGPLMGKNLIERFNMYRRVNLRPPESSASGEAVEVAVGDIQIGGSLNGHDGIVHGGIISLLFDDAMGWGYEALLMSDSAQNLDATIVTANLNIDFRKPLPERTRTVIRVFHERSEGRKIFFRARMESQDGSVVYSEATSLFIILKDRPPLKEQATGERNMGT